MAIIRPLIGLATAAALWLGMGPGADMTGFGAAFSAEGEELSSETRDLPPFSRIRVRGGFEIQIKVGAEQNVLVETVGRDLKRVETVVRDETLILSFRERLFSFLFDNPKIVTISLPALRGMEFVGGSDVKVTGIDSEDLDLIAEGAADITLAGSCGALEFNLNGAGDVWARELLCRSVVFRSNGVADAQIYASEAVDVGLNGLGSVEVYGNPENVSKHVNGLGSIEIVE